MFRKTHHRLHTFWLGLALLGLMAMGLGGGFDLSVSVPQQPSEGSIVLVSPLGCGHPTDAQVSGSAEGLVEGRRLSLPLDLKMDSSGSYRIRREWPQEGVWLLAFTATYRGMTRSVLVELGSDGFARTVKKKRSAEPATFAGKKSMRKLSSGEIDTALHALSSRLSP